MYVISKCQVNERGNVLVAAFILCNVKQETVYRIKNAYGITSTFLKDAALYLTSIVFLNWITSKILPDLVYVKFLQDK